MQLALEEHPTVEALEELCFNRLPPPVLDAVEEHLLVCESCQRTLEEVEEYIQLMKVATAEYAAESRHIRTPVTRALQNLRETAKKSSLGSATPWTALVLAGVLAATWAYSNLRTDVPVPTIPIRLVALRGGDSNAFTRAPAHRPLGLAIDTTELSGPRGTRDPASYRLEIVSSSGNPVWDSVALLSGGEIVARTPKNMHAGVYWVRLYAGPRNELLREYGLRLE